MKYCSEDITHLRRDWGLGGLVARVEGISVRCRSSLTKMSQEEVVSISLLFKKILKLCLTL
jgi:hypothetical protein